MKKITCQFCSLPSPPLPLSWYLKFIHAGHCRRRFQEPARGQSLDFIHPCQVTGLLRMNALLSNEQFHFEMIYILFINIIICTVIYIISPVRGILRSMLEEDVFTEELYRARALFKRIPTWKSRAFWKLKKVFLETDIWVCINFSQVLQIFSTKHNVNFAFPFPVISQTL